jgi:hypothetical protein
MKITAAMICLASFLGGCVTDDGIPPGAMGSARYVPAKQSSKDKVHPWCDGRYRGPFQCGDNPGN